MTARTFANGLALAVAGFCLAATASGNELEDLEVTMEVVDGPAELGEILAELRAPRANRVVETSTEGAEAAERGSSDAREERADPFGEDRFREFDDDFLNESTEADFEHEDSFEEGEIVDEDIFDELPMDDMGGNP